MIHMVSDRSRDPTRDPTQNTIILRDYQELAVRHILSSVHDGIRDCYFSCPTGTGKAVILSSVAQELASGGRVLVIVHTQELVFQLASTLRRCFPPSMVGVVMNVHDECNRRITVACIATIRHARRLDLILGGSPLPFAALLIDECHHATPVNSYGNVARAIRVHSPNAAIIGCTATPYRADKQRMQHLLPVCVFARDIADMIEAGWLAPLSWRRVPLPVDFSAIPVATVDGERDYASHQLSIRLNSPAINDHIAHATAPLLAGRRVIVFAADVAHAQDLAASYNAAGITCAAAWGEMPNRDQTVKAWKAGDPQAVTNCQLFTEGFDFPAIDAIVIARPTQSLGRYVQMIGRGTRLADNKAECLIIDVVGNEDITDPRQIILPDIMPVDEDHPLDARATEPDEDRPPRMLNERILYLVDPRNDSRYVWTRDKTSGAYYLPLNELATLVLSRDPYGSGLYSLARYTRRHEGLDQQVIPAFVEWLHPAILPLPGIRAIAQEWIAEHARQWLARRDMEWRSLDPTPKQLDALARFSHPAHDRAVAECWNRGQVSQALAAAFFRKDVAPRLTRLWTEAQP